MNEISEVLTELFSLEGRRGIVTGASGGLGGEIATLLAKAGAEVFGFSRSRSGLDHPRITEVAVDITDPRAVEREVAAVGRDGLDFLVNNAGMTLKKRAGEISDLEFHQVHALNIEAMFTMCRTAYPYLRQAGTSGRIVNISSMAAHLGLSLVAPYCSSKTAVIGLTRGLAIEWVNDRILVNSVAPGWFPTKMSASVMDEDRKRKILNRIPMGTFRRSANRAGADDSISVVARRRVHHRPGFRRRRGGPGLRPLSGTTLSGDIRMKAVVCREPGRVGTDGRPGPGGWTWRGFGENPQLGDLRHGHSRVGRPSGAFQLSPYLGA